MTTIDFAERHGFQAEPTVYNERDQLPENVRKRAGEMMVEHCERFVIESYRGKAAYRIGPWKFVQLVRSSFPPTHDLWDWHEKAIESITDYTRSSNWRSNWIQLNRLIRPLMVCEWAWFYTVAENFYSAWMPKWPSRANNFATEFNFLLAAHSIPWMLQSGLVVPADEYEFTDELEYLEQVSAEGDVSDPRVSLKKAFAALFRKQGGPDITSACFHAWIAWETVREAAGGVNSVKAAYPELWEAVTAWKKLIHAGRHPGTEQDRLPTADEARFIVGLLTNAVRLVSSPAVSDEPS